MIRPVSKSQGVFAMVCPSCRTTNSDDATACSRCGTLLPVDDSTLIVTDPAIDPLATMDMASHGTWAQPATTMGEGVAMAALQPGTVVAGRYEIVKLLGEGGMGAVYRAQDRELERVVALKVIRPELARNAQVLQRFKQELILARQITHRNIIRIFDLGHAEGMRFITMEFIEGEDVSGILARRGKLPAHEAVAIVTQVARGLEAAHSEGVVHRDLKPQNVMMDAAGKASVMDFGIARSMDASNMTRTGALLGTPTYMSPEQAQGKKVDARSDIYTLGIIFYELLTGRPPFEADNPMATLVRRLQEKPAPPIQMEPSIPKPINEMVLKMLGTKPEERYQSAAELLIDLDAWEAQRTGRTPLGGVAPRVQHGIPLTHVAAAILFVVCLGIWLYWKKGTVPPPAARARLVTVLVSDFENATRDSVFDGTLEPTFTLALEGASFISSYNRGDARKAAAQLQPGFTRLDYKLAQLVATREGINYVVAGVIEGGGGNYTIRARALDTRTGTPLVEKSTSASSKQDVLAAAAKLAAPIRKALGDTNPERATETYSSSSLEASQFYAQGQALQEDGKFKDAITAYTKAIVFDPEMGRAYNGLAVSHSALRNRQEAADNFNLALSKTARMTEREQYRTRGAYYLFVRNDQKAVDEFTALTKQYPADSAGRINLATAFLYTRNVEAAREQGRMAVAINMKRARNRSNNALYAMYAGAFDDAIREAAEAMQLNQAYPKPFLTTSLSLFAQGKTAEAEASYHKLEALDKGSASLATMGLADMALYAGKLGEGTAILEKGMAADAPASSDMAYKLVALAGARRNKAQAIDAANRALAISMKEGFSFAAARVLVESGQEVKALQVAKELGARLEAEPRAYGKLIEGEIQLLKGKTQAAVDLFQEARKLLDTWIGRLDLGRAYLEAGHFTEAASEFDACEKRKGEATSLFLDEVPTFRYYPQLYYFRARAQEGLKSAAAGSLYKEFLTIKASAEPGEPLVADALKRAKALGVPGL